jgi:hypothetical protein
MEINNICVAIITCITSGSLVSRYETPTVSPIGSILSKPNILAVFDTSQTLTVIESS